MRYKLEPHTFPEPEAVLSLNDDGDGNVDLMIDDWFVLRLTKQGQLELYSDLPYVIGLDVDEDGVINLGPQSGDI